METISLSFAGLIMYYFGFAGLIFIIWHFDGRRFAKKDEARQQELDKVLEQRRQELEVTLNAYRNDVAEIRKLYESNSRLVKSVTEAFTRLEIIYGETIGVISLNTQTQTHLADCIKNNQYCPVVRKAGPQ